MDIRIKANPEGEGCKVWLGSHTVSFKTIADAQAYVEQLRARIDAASHAFEGDPEPGTAQSSAR